MKDALGSNNIPAQKKKNVLTDVEKKDVQKRVVQVYQNTLKEALYSCCDWQLVGFKKSH